VARNKNFALIKYVAKRLRDSGRTMDMDNWSEVVAEEAIKAMWDFADVERDLGVEVVQ
jgi:hypothetical protein